MALNSFLSLPEENDASSHPTLEVPTMDISSPLELVTMDDVHKRFGDLVNEFRTDVNADRFIQEYEKLYDALRMSHRQTKTWELKTEYLVKELKSNTDKLNLAVHLTQEDRSTIASLNTQLSDAWSTIEDLSERENKARDTVARLQDEIFNLTGLVEDGMGVEELTKLGDRAESDVKILHEQMDVLKGEKKFIQNRCDEILAKYEEKKQEMSAHDSACAALTEKLKKTIEDDRLRSEDAQQYIFRLERLKVRLNGDVDKLEIDNGTLRKQLKNKQEHADVLQHDLDKFVKLYRSERSTSGRLRLNLGAAQDTIKTSKNKIEKLELQAKTMEEKRKITDLELKSMGTDLKEKHRDLGKKERENNGLKRKLTTEQCKLNACNDNLVSTKVESKNLEDSLKHTKITLESLNDKLSATMDKLNVSDIKLKKTEKQKEEVAGELLLSGRMNAKLYTYIQTCREQIRDGLIAVAQVSNEKDKLLRQVNKYQSDIEKVTEDLELSGIVQLAQAVELRKSEASEKKALSSRMDALTERDRVKLALERTELANSNLIIANDNFEQQAHHMMDEASSLQREIDTLEDRLTKLGADYNNLNNNLLLEQQEVKKLKAQISQKEQDLYCCRNMTEHLKINVSDLNIEIQQLTAQRNIIGCKCLKEQKKNSMLMEHSDMLKCIMKSGEKMYAARMREIKSLKLDNLDIYRQKEVLMRRLQYIKDLKSKLGLANQELVAYKAKCKALEDRAPISIHKWQHMKARDESNFETVLKNAHLTKELITRTDEVARLKSELIEKANVVKELKDMLARAPGHDMAIKSTAERKEKEAMAKKLKACLAEKNMAEWTVKEKEDEVKKLKHDLDEERKKRLKIQEQSPKKKDTAAKQGNTLFLPPIIITRDGNPVQQ